MEDLQLSPPIPVEDIQKSVEESQYEFMDTSENCHQASEQYSPFNGLQAMEDTSIIVDSALQYNQSNGGQISTSNGQLVPLIVNFPVTETGFEVVCTSEVNKDKLSVQQAEHKSGTDVFDEIWSFLNCSRAEELSIQSRNSGPISLNPQADDTEEQFEGDWDSTYQPIDEHEPHSLVSAEKSISCIQRACSISHDHSYTSFGTKESSWLNIDMNKDENLHKGLNLNTNCNDVQELKTKNTPTNIKDSQKRNSLRNKKNLLRELRHIRVVADIERLKTDKLRQLVPRLVRFLYYQHDDQNRRGIYKVAPPDWPGTTFFGDPCNRIADGGRPRKEMLTEMTCELFTRYQLVRASSTDDVNDAVEA